MNSTSTTINSDLKGLGYIFGVLVLSIILATFLTPLACDLLISIKGELVFPFSRVFDRVILVVLIGLVFIFRKKLPSIELVKQTLKVDNKFQPLLFGFILGVFSAGSILVINIFNGTLDFSSLAFKTKGLKVLLIPVVAIVVGFLEEVVFRGLIFLTLKKYSSVIFSVFFTSLLYATVHFIKPDKTYVYNYGDFFSGVTYILQVVTNLFNAGVPFGIVGLTLASFVLISALKYRGNLYIPIGIHAGWVFILKFAVYFTIVQDGVIFPKGLGRRYFMVGTYGFWIMCLFLLGLFYLLSKRLKE